MAIHLVQRAQALLPCSRATAAGDAVVLLGEGVNALLLVRSQCVAVDCYACATDVSQRGLTTHLPTGVTLISDGELVALCAEHSPVVTWTKP